MSPGEKVGVDATDTVTGENNAANPEQQRRSGRKHARSDSRRSEEVEEKGRIEAGKRRRRVHESVDRVDRARAIRAAAREEAAGRIGEIAEREGITL